MIPILIKMIHVLRLLVRGTFEGKMYVKTDALLDEIEMECRRLEDDGK